MTAIDDLRILASEIHTKRLDWDYQGILTALAKFRNKGTLDELRAAAFKAARNPHASTPNAIGWAVSWSGKDTEPGDNVGGYDPLPECSECFLPVRRRDAEQLEECPHCHHPWTPNMLDTVDVDEQLRIGENAPARLGKARFTDVRARLTRSVPGPDPVLAARTRVVACPWCAAPAGQPCVVPKSGKAIVDTSSAKPLRDSNRRPILNGAGKPILDPRTVRIVGRGPDRVLTHTTAHQARHDAAGTGTARIDAGWVRARTASRAMAAQDTEPDVEEEPERERYP